MAEERTLGIGEAHHDGVTTDAYHEGLSRLGAAVCIITTHGPAGRCGLTASSVTSVSDHPPIVLACVDKQARTCDILTENGVFAINVLKAGSETLSNAFAGRSTHSLEESFGLADWHYHDGGTGAPVLHGSRVSLDCRVIDRLDSGTHRVFFGQVIAVHLGNMEPPLIYVDRGYKSVGT